MLSLGDRNVTFKRKYIRKKVKMSYRRFYNKIKNKTEKQKYLL